MIPIKDKEEKQAPEKEAPGKTEKEAPEEEVKEAKQAAEEGAMGFLSQAFREDGCPCTQ